MAPKLFNALQQDFTGIVWTNKAEMQKSTETGIQPELLKEVCIKQV
jgi:hypothetical protein